MKQNNIRLAVSVLVTFLLLPATAAPPPATDRTLTPSDRTLNPEATQAHYIQIVGSGPLWRKDTGLSDRVTSYRVGIQITDRTLIAAFIGTLHRSGKMIWLNRRTASGNIGVFISYTPHPQPNPAAKGLTFLTEPFYISYVRTGDVALLFYRTSVSGQIILPAYAARLEAVVRRAARMARRHRKHVTFFHYDQAELAPS